MQGRYHQSDLWNARHRRRCASAIRALPSTVLGPVGSPPWNRRRLFPGTTLMMHGAPCSCLGAAPRPKFALQHQPTVHQAALEHPATPMPFSTGYFQSMHIPPSAPAPPPHELRKPSIGSAPGDLYSYQSVTGTAKARYIPG
jgi:hypothetical protein